MKGNRILAIDPGARELGVAILEGAELLYYGIKTIRQRETSQVLLRTTALILERMVQDYQPTILALEQPRVLQPGAEKLALVVKEIKRIAQREGLKLYTYSPKNVRQFICREERPTKHETARRLVTCYPELARYLLQPSKWEEQYYARMFEAIAVGLLCYHDLSAAGS